MRLVGSVLLIAVSLCILCRVPVFGQDGFVSPESEGAQLQQEAEASALTGTASEAAPVGTGRGAGPQDPLATLANTTFGEVEPEPGPDAAVVVEPTMAAESGPDRSAPDSAPRSFQPHLDTGFSAAEMREIQTFEAPMYAAYEAHLEQALSNTRTALASLTAQEADMGLAGATNTALWRDLAQQAAMVTRRTRLVLSMLFTRSLGPAETHVQPFFWEEFPDCTHPSFLAANLHVKMLRLEQTLTMVRRRQSQPDVVAGTPAKAASGTGSQLPTGSAAASPAKLAERATNGTATVAASGSAAVGEAVAE